MGTYARAVELVELLDQAGVRAVADPRSAHAPCVLLQPPARTYDLPLPAYTVTWRLLCLAPGPGTADAWNALDDLADRVVAALELDGTTVEPISYQLPGGDSLPAYVVTITEGLNP